MNPRLSLQGRMSIDGWAGVGVSPGGPRSAHGRQSSLYHSQSNTLFNAFDEHEHAGRGEHVGLQNLREEESEDDDDDDLALKYDERSRLNGGARNGGSRSQSHSPLPNNPSLTDVRIAPR